MDEENNILEGLVRIGTVIARDSSEHIVRVTYKDTDTPSGWLPVLQRGGDIWLPSINDNVLVLYLPVFNGDGFVLGAI